MTRQKQRKSVFQMVYTVNYQGVEQKDSILEEFYRQHELDEHIDYIDQSFLGVCEHLEEIDPMIEASLTNWSMKRLNAVCLAILRLAVYEIKFNPDVPDRVAINEAIELAKEFGEADSSSFVHGVLGSIVK